MQAGTTGTTGESLGRENLPNATLASLMARCRRLLVYRLADLMRTSPTFPWSSIPIS